MDITSKFDLLVDTIHHTHQSFQQKAIKAVNINLTLRNWLIGYYIVEFEQKGEDRAQYGEQLVPSLSKKLGIKGLAETNLKLSRQFYNIYPSILELLLQNSENWLPENIRQSTTDELQITISESITIRQSATDELRGTQNVANIAELGHGYLLQIIQKTSFTHFVELLKIEDDIKRKFYELLILKTTPSVKELQRHINTLAYERLGLSNDVELSFDQMQQKIEPEQALDAVKSVYFFDFLGLNTQKLVEEKDLETALLNHLQEFILELGHGFCFEARQQRILIDDEYYFADLVFYHRILKCHILVE